MSAVGLTAAMRARLLLVAQGQNILQRDWEIVCAQNFAAMQCGFRMLTPRGHAALAAPRMTVSQLALLEFLSTRSSARVTRAQWNAACNLKDRGFVVVSLCDDPAYAAITPSGLKALNDVRAAMGGELYKDNMP